MYKSLIEEGLAPAFISGNGYEGFSKEVNFFFSIKNFHKTNLNNKNITYIINYILITY